jgi:cytidine deaminase
MRDALVMDLLEFGRVIHAEMSSICDAARLGRSVRDATLFCTTFPCHICSKHIVASGVRRVVYIEPYPKSYAEVLHSDSISVGAAGEGGKVAFMPFIGISPYRYRDIFERGRRKSDAGASSEWVDGQPRPIVKFTVATYLQNETAATAILQQKLDALTQEKLITMSKGVGGQSDPPA